MFFPRIFSGLLAVTTLFGAGALGYALPGACSGECWSHDPAVIQRTSDKVYFRFETGGHLRIWKSSSLTGPWVYQGVVLPNGSKINLAGKDDVWAPDVRKVGDKYIAYYSVSQFGTKNSAIGYATSSTLEAGSWTDYGSVGVSSSANDGKVYNAIDPALILAGSTYYLAFGSFWGDIHLVQLNAAATKTSGTAKQIQYQPTSPSPAEGAFIYYRSGYYYLFWSEGICCGMDKNKPAAGKEYKIRVARSASVTGPYVDKTGASALTGGGTTVLASHNNIYGPGGQGIFVDSSRGSVLYYHYSNTNVGLADSQTTFGWNVLSWSGGWPSV